MTPAVDVGKVSDFVALVDPSAAPKLAKKFPPSVEIGDLRDSNLGPDDMRDVPDGIIVHLARDCRGNVQDHHVVDVAWRSFTK
jgi:hypothetical protein